MISTIKFLLLLFYMFASVEIQARILLEHSGGSRIKPSYGRAPSRSPPPSPASAPPKEEISGIFPAVEKDLESFLSMVTSNYERIWGSCKKGMDVTNYGRGTPPPPPAPHHAPPQNPFGSGGVASAKSTTNPFLAST